MKMQLFYKLVVFVLIGVVAVHGQCPTNVDPCLDTVYQVLDDPSRSTSHTFNGPENDFFISENWYRSISKAGGDMPQAAPTVSSCNAFAPIWLSGNIPSTADGIRNVDACAVFLGGNCVRSYTIPIKNCGAYRVYCLSSTNAYDRYCFGSESPCPAGSSSPTGYTPNCQTIDNTLTLTNEPSISFAVNYVAIDVPNVFTLCQPYYEFLCNVVHNDPTVFLDVQWYADVSADATQRELVAEFVGANAIAYADLPSRITSTMLVNMGYLLGTHITCRVNARAVQSNTANIGPSKEVTFFAGVNVADSSQFIELEEGGNPGTYTGTYTIPFRCEFHVLPNGQCRDDLHVCTTGVDIGVANVESQNGGCPATGQDVTIQVPREDGCVIESGEYGFSIEVNANPDHVYNPKREMVLQLQVLNGRNEFWNGAFLPRAVVAINDTDVMLGGSNCFLSDDPHIQSFDSTTWTEIQLEGVFLLYKHRTLPISVEAYFKKHSSGYFTRNCGGAVRSGGQVFVYDNCRENEPRRITLYECDEGLQQMIVNQISSTSYEIILPTGTRVILGTSRQYVYPSIFDWGQTEGICGNFNGIDTPEDDKVIRNTNTVDYGTPHPRWTTRLEHNDFSNSYRIPEEETLYFGYVRDALDYDDLYFCQCSGNNNNPGAGCSVSPNVDCLAGDNPNASGFSHRCTLNRKKRQAINPDTEDPVPDTLFEFDPNYVARFDNIPGRWNERSATNHCTQLLNNNVNVQACKRVPHVNIEKALDNCIADILMTGTTEFDQLHINVFLDLCKEEVTRYNFTANGTTPVVITPEEVQDITDLLCPESCSGNGVCVKGACRCSRGFSGVSCDINLLAPPVLFELSNNGICDVNVRPCRQVVLAADHFLNERVVCKVQLVNAQGVPLLSEKIFPAEYVHSQKVICPLNFGLEVPPRAPYFVALSASNDGQSFSDVKTLAVIDSSSGCQRFDISYDGLGEFQFDVINEGGSLRLQVPGMMGNGITLGNIYRTRVKINRRGLVEVCPQRAET